MHSAFGVFLQAGRITKAADHELLLSSLIQCVFQFNVQRIAAMLGHRLEHVTALLPSVRVKTHIQQIDRFVSTN